MGDEIEIFLDDTVLPEVPLKCTLREAEVMFKGERWVVHLNDADPFPSRPHAHNYELGLKLHLGNGRLYRRAEYAGGDVNRRNLVRLRDLLAARGIRLPNLEV